MKGRDKMDIDRKAQLKFSFDTVVTFSAPVAEHQLALRCLPMQDSAQTLVQCTPVLDPGRLPEGCQDAFGSTVCWCSIRAPHTSLHYGSSGVAQVAYTNGGTPAPAPLPALRYAGARTKPGRDILQAYSALAPGGRPPLVWADALRGGVHDLLRYAPGATGVSTTAEQALAGGCGVCQDYAHLYVALARLGGLSARYVMGLTVGEGATHAWAEVYANGAWYGFDPTRNCKVDEHYLRFGAGRDAADCPIEQGSFWGNADQTQTVYMKVEAI